MTIIGGADGPTTIFLAGNKMDIAFLIWTIICICFLGIGIYSRFSKKEVGFWANAKVIEATDVQAYNKAVSKLWIVFAILFELLGVPFLFMKQNSPLVIISILGTVFLVIGIILAYTMIENKYRK